MDDSQDSLELYFEKDEKETNFIECTEHIRDTIENEMKTLPKEPEDYLERILFYFYYSVQYLVLFSKTDGIKPTPDINDSDERLKEIAYFIHLEDSYYKFNGVIPLIAKSMFDLVNHKLYNHIEKNGYDDHPLVFFMKKIIKHKEMHSRRIKSDPAASRTKVDNINATYNSVTQEKYDPNNKDHKSWRMLIINPLPSDYNYKSIDQHEGGEIHEYNVELDKLNGNYNVPDPFFIVVTTEWEKVFRLLHTLLHFEEYMHT